MARDYAVFRAKMERERKSWLHWPVAGRDGTLTSDDYDESAYHYHLYVQWQCDEQTRRLRDQTKEVGTALYLDFPLGVNRDGFDVWRERELFALSASGGAPPDGLFVKGQNWGFPPFNPEAVRRQEYRYYIECLRHHMALAGMLRIDHVMGLHRAFWVPEGFSAADGLYVHHPAAGILCDLEFGIPSPVHANRRRKSRHRAVLRQRSDGASRYPRHARGHLRRQPDGRNRPG